MRIRGGGIAHFFAQRGKNQGVDGVGQDEE